MKFLSLFAGIGLHDLGLTWAGMEVVGQVEYDEYCTQILEARFPGIPRWTYIKEVTAEAIATQCGQVDLVTGGFPCQDISVAGNGVGIDEGKRSGLWSEMYRIISGIRPTWVLVENVPALRSRGADRVLSELEAIGYSCWPMVVGAGHFAAPHRRQRVWIVGYSKRHGRGARRGEPGEHGSGTERAGGERAEGLQPQSGGSDHEELGVEHAERERCSERHAADFTDLTRLRGWPAPPGPQREWEAERIVKSGMGSATDGRTRRLAGSERRAALKALGNANPPQVVEAIGRAILKLTGEFT